MAVVALALGITACEAAPASAPSPGPSAGASATPETDPLVAFYGDSFTLGTGASDPSRRWTTLLSAERGWRELNPSVNGLGYVNARSDFGENDVPALIIEAQPDIVIVTMGLNDNFSYDQRADLIRETIFADLTRMSEGIPAARIVVVEPFWFTDGRPASLEQIIAWSEEAAAEIGADWIPGASRWLEGHYAGSADSWIAADDVHPSDVGYRQIADRMDAALAQLDPPV